MIIRLYLGRQIGNKTSNQVNPLKAFEQVATYWGAFTMTEGVGCWGGRAEPTLIFERQVEGASAAKEKKLVKVLAQHLCLRYKQNQVLVVFLDSTHFFLSANHEWD